MGKKYRKILIPFRSLQPQSEHNEGEKNIKST